jgi:hypothetical protein
MKCLLDTILLGVSIAPMSYVNRMQTSVVSLKTIDVSINSDVLRHTREYRTSCELVVPITTNNIMRIE